jgi:cholesterol oxidase
VSGSPRASADPIWSDLFRQWVPEIFAPLPDPPDHTEAIVVGSGFGAAITALRLAQAGVANTVLERGSRWPNDPHREIFTGDDLPDGRGFWHRTEFTGVTKVAMNFANFGGVLDVTPFDGIDVWRGAAVGGGSVVYTGAMIEPERRFFDQIFGGTVAFDEMDRVYYPRVRQMLRTSTTPSRSPIRDAGMPRRARPDSPCGATTRCSTGTCCGPNCPGDRELRPPRPAAIWATPTARSSTSTRTI